VCNWCVQSVCSACDVEEHQPGPGFGLGQGLLCINSAKSTQMLLCIICYNCPTNKASLAALCSCAVWVDGCPVQGQDGEDGASLLAPDELPVELLPGPAAALVADCCQQLECGTRGLLEALPVKVVDGFGNLCESASFEVGGGNWRRCQRTWWWASHPVVQAAGGES